MIIDYGVGIETVGYVTKGVTTLALFLILFALQAAIKKGYISKEKYNEVFEELTDIPSRHQTIQNHTWEFYHKNKAALTSMNVCYCCGFIQGYGIATEAALKIGETIQIPSFAYEAEEFIHGPHLQLTPYYTLFFIDDFSLGSDRLIQIYQAAHSVSEPLLSPLYLLPFFQIIAYQVTTDLNKWNKHPMLANFEKYVDSKTETIKKVMPD